MKHHFDPTEIRTLCNAFEKAWRALETETAAADCAAVREHVGRAIVHRALSGNLDEARLASYAAYQGRRFMGRRVASITIRRDCSDS